MSLLACTVDAWAAGTWWNHGFSDADLLCYPRRNQLAGFVYHLEGVDGWRLLAKRQDVWSCSRLVCRSRVPGVRSALEWAGATEQGPDHRWMLHYLSMVRFHGRLLRLFGNDRKECGRLAPCNKGSIVLE